MMLSSVTCRNLLRFVNPSSSSFSLLLRELMSFVTPLKSGASGCCFPKLNIPCFFGGGGISCCSGILGSFSGYLHRRVYKYSFFRSHLETLLTIVVIDFNPPLKLFSARRK